MSLCYIPAMADDTKPSQAPRPEISTLERCMHFEKDGKRCELRRLDGRQYCEAHKADRDRGGGGVRAIFR
jgi:hypothetical protein